MTADSLPSRTAEGLGAEPKPAADAHIISDLLAETQRHTAAHAEHSLRLDLEIIERMFGRALLDERVRSSVEAARSRALGLCSATGRASEGIVYTFATDLFVSLAVERPWRRQDAYRVVLSLTGHLKTDADDVVLQLLTGALRAPQLLELPPLVALDVQLSMLLALSPAAEASIWIKDETGRPECLIAVGETATTRRFRAVAGETLDGPDAASDRGTIVGIPIRRWQVPWAALVTRVQAREAVRTVLEEAAAAISPIMERDFLLQRSAERERSLVKASERRLSRLGFDLHDGALQLISALGADFRELRPRLASEDVGELDGMASRLREVDRVLRELAHSLEPASLLRRPLERVVLSEVEALNERSGIDVQTRIVGDFGAMTQSQKIALIRVVQEALSNIREHSNAKNVDLLLTASRSCVELQIVDDGDGFEVTRTLQNAAQRGRMGVVGSSERVRLLGGTFDIRSRPGGPTTVGVTLPRWQPLAADQSALQLAY